jgi:hypothetical protein
MSVHEIDSLTCRKVKDMAKQTCLIIACYDGKNEREDGGVPCSQYIVAHLHNLNKYRHKCDIVFVIAEDGRTEVETKEKDSITYIYRPNIGFSQGSWIEAFKVLHDKYDYYIFGEDDYVFIMHEFDAIFLRRFDKWNSHGTEIPSGSARRKKGNADYVVSAMGGRHPHAHVSTVGITSSEVLVKAGFLEIELVGKDLHKGAKTGAVMNRLRRLDTLGKKYGAFPYWRQGNIQVYGSSAEETMPQILSRSIICPYQMLDENFDVHSNFVRVPKEDLPEELQGRFIWKKA